MRDSSNGKAIKITPEELIFDSVVTNQAYTQQLTLKNSLSAPVEISFKASNTERLEIEPKSKKLAPFESCVIDVTFKISKPFPPKTTKQKDIIFIKSDFFDQKVNVTIIPSLFQGAATGTTPRESSLGSSTRFNITGKETGNNLVQRLNVKRDTSKDLASGRNQNSKEFSPKASFQNMMPGLERELELKSSQLIDLADQLEKQEMETQVIIEQLNQETQKRREIEEKLFNSSSGNGNSNQDHLVEIKNLLKEREPNLEVLMDLTLKKERDQQERKDTKILEILRMKDKQIEEIQQKAVAQETEYGKLAQVFQEAKKRIKQLEEETEKQKKQTKEMSDQIEIQQQQLKKFEQNNSMTNFQKIEQEYAQTVEQLQQLQEQFWLSEQALSQKTQNEEFFSEAIDRLKNQLQQKDGHIQSLDKDVSYLREDKVRGEEQIKQLMNQLTQAQQENQNERTLSMQKLKSNNDVIERINKLQDDKSQLLDTLDQLKNEQNLQNDRFRHLLERSNAVLPLGNMSSSSASKATLMDQVESQFEELTRSLREINQENKQLSTKLKERSTEIQHLEAELSQLLEEKEQLEIKIMGKKKVNSTQTQIDMVEMDQILYDYKNIRAKADQTEYQLQKVQSDSKQQQIRINQLQNELDKSKQEFNMVMRSQQANSQAVYGQMQDFNGSLMSSTCFNNNQDEVVSRLNAKITSMKLIEEKLQQQISQLTAQLQDNKQQDIRQLQASTSTSQPNHRMIGLEERLGEYEIILMQQREQLVQLEEQNFSLIQDKAQIQRQKENELEQLQFRLKNLNEINKKHEQISTNRDTRASVDTVLGFSISGKSTSAEVEKLRQYAQQLELNNMSLKHSIEALQLEKDQAQEQCEQVKQELQRSQNEQIRIKQDVRLQGIGLTASESHLQKINEQKAKIKQLEGLLIRAKQDYDKINSSQKNGKQGSSFQWTGQRLEDVLQTNEKLRHEHMSMVSAVMDLKEEYSDKLHQISAKYEAQRQKVKQENISLQRKLETLTSQMGYMEKKELRLIGQLEELKHISLQENDDKEHRLKEIENLLVQKDDAMSEMEREIIQKDRSLQERQDQIGVLIDTLENEHSGDELRQKVLNLSAELCSLKSIEAQQEKRANEMFHQLKMLEQNHSKDQKICQQLKQSKENLSNELEKANSSIYELQNKIQENEISNNDLNKECSEWKYKCERQELQLSMKEDALAQLREQIRRSEAQFKEQVIRIRKDFSDRAANNNIKGPEYQKNLTLPFKQSVQQLHLLLADYHQQNVQPAEHLLAQDFERTLIIASQTIENLQNSLDKQEYTIAALKNEYTAFVHNQILIARQEQLVTGLQGLELAFSKREDETERHSKQQEFNYCKLIKELEIKANHYEKQLQEEIDNNRSLEEQLKDIKAQKEDLELSVVCFQQEVGSQRLAMERKAELTVDERYKSKHEAIKSYFDSNITKILLSQGTSNKFLELGREICALKIVIQSLEAKLIADQSDREGLESNIALQKQQVAQQESKIRELGAKLRKQQDSQKTANTSIKMELEKKKNENLQLEKELIKAREMIDEKLRALNKLQNNNSKVGSFEFPKEKFNDNESKEKLARSQQQINELQEKIVELRSQHILELEGCRAQYEIDIVEAKRHLNEERQQMDKKFRPGQAPGELIEKNEQLKAKVVEMRSAMDNLTQENLILRKKVESEKMGSQIHQKDLQAYKQALQELESTMIEGGGGNYSQHQSNQMLIMSQKPQQVSAKHDQSKRSSSKGQQRKTVHLQFNKDSTINEDTNDHMTNQSRFFQQDSSLNVSEMTSVNNPRLSQSMMGGFQANAINAKQFVINPPSIVKALVSSKINELKANSRLQDLVDSEISLRDNLKQLTIQLRELEASGNSKIQKDSIDKELSLKSRRLMELELENEDLKIALAQSKITDIQNDQMISTMKEQQNNLNVDQGIVQLSDYSVLVESILSLSIQLAKYETNQQYSQQQAYIENVEQAQRMVIKSLSDRLFQGRSNIDLQYVPSEENDRKVWYLELLEQQLDNSDQTIKALQNFIKKLQIEISGNLQSAAQIKAASMDLAQNTKKTSEEIKAVSQIVGLIRHDVQSMMSQGIQQKTMQQSNQHQQQQQTMSRTAVNPFLDIIDPKATHIRNPHFENLQSNNESLQNQLTITEKVKKTLESEIVQLKISHAQELQQLSSQFHQSSDQRDSLLQNNEELHEKVLKLEQHLENLKQEISGLNMSYENNQHILQEKEKEKEQLAKTKTTTSKHLQKLQQDMAEWRKQTDENMKTKEKQVAELTLASQSLSQERDRLKAENSMLRKNQKDRNKTDSEEVKKLDQQIEQLEEQLAQEKESRKKETEFWITERATMREMIDQLESDKAGIGIKQDAIIGSTEDQLKQIKKKSIKKLKVKDTEIKNKDKQMSDLVSELQKLKMSTTHLEQRLREMTTRLSEAEDRERYQHQKLKEVELERDLILAERNNAISSNDLTAQQIQIELNSLRECFSKLKVERDSLLNEIEQTTNKEQEQHEAINTLNEEIVQLEGKLQNQGQEKSASMQMLESKNNALLQDVRYLRQENEKIKQRIKDADQNVLMQEKRIHDEDMKVWEQKYQNDTLQRQLAEQQQQITRRDQMIQDLQGQIVLIEGGRFKDIEALKQKLQDFKDQNSQIVGLYESQIDYLRNKFITDKKLSEQKVEQVLNIGQREAVIRSLKKEVTQLKCSLSKVKAKNKELKVSSGSKQSENVSVNQGKGVKNSSVHSKLASSKQTIAQQEETSQQEKAVVKIAEMLSSDEGFKGMLEQLQKTNELVYKVVECEAEVAKMESQNKQLTEQLLEQQDINTQLSHQYEELFKKELKESKIAKQTHSQQELSKQYKQEIKALQAEISKMKEEWLGPEDFRAMQEQLREQQSQIKAAKDEVQRKREVITTIKQQREQTESEANQVMQNMEDLKDDNNKLQRLIKEHNKNLNAMKELKQSNDYLKASEKRLKEEISSLNDKLKLLRVDLARKDQIIKDYKDKLDAASDEVNQSKERQSEIERLKEMVKKNKLEAEIKEN